MISRKTILSAVCLLGLLLMAACAQTPAGEDLPETGATEPGGTEPTPAGSDPLANTRWVLESYGPPGAETPVIGDTPVTLEFDNQGGASGSGGCNSYSGPYTIEDSQLNFGELVSTLIACEDEGIGEQEAQFYSALESAGEFEVSDDRLVISYAGGAEVLNFIPANGE